MNKLQTLFDLFGQIERTATFLGDAATARRANQYRQELHMLGYLDNLDTNGMRAN